MTLALNFPTEHSNRVNIGMRMDDTNECEIISL